MTVELLTGRRWRTVLDETIENERATFGFGPFEQWWTRERAPQSVKRLLAKSREQRGFYAAASTFATPEGNPVAAPTSFTAVASTNVETNLWVPGIWTPIPANSMYAGKVYEHKCGGVLGTSSSAPTNTWTPRVGQSATPATNISMGASTAVTMVASLSAVPWFSQFTFTIRSLGLAASGVTATGNGFVVIGGITTTAGVVQSIGSAIPTTVDSTAATGYILSITPGTNHANNTTQAQFVSPVFSYN